MVKNTKKETSKKRKKTPAKEVVAKAKTAPRIKKDTSDINPEFTDMFIQEINEDIKNDQLKVLWNRYGLFIIIFVVLAVSAAVSFEKIRDWRIAQNQTNTENYMAATRLQETPEATIEALQKINNENRGIFSDFAKLQIANVLFSQNKIEEALTQLNNIIEDKQVNAEVKNIALMKAATYKIDTMSYEEFSKMLQPIIDENNSWSPLAQDLLAMSAIQNGDLETAKALYQNLLKIKDLPENFRTKIQDMLSSIADM